MSETFLIKHWLSRNQKLKKTRQKLLNVYENYASVSIFLEVSNFSILAKSCHYWLFSEAHGDMAPPDFADTLTERNDSSLANLTGSIELNTIKT